MRLSTPSTTLSDIAQTDAATFRNKDLPVSTGLCFWGVGQSGPVAGQNSHVQLFNPAGSGVQVLLDGIILRGTANAVIDVGFHNTALTVLGTAGANKDNGAAAPVAVIRTQDNVGALATVLKRVTLDGGGGRDISPLFPYLFGESEGIVIQTFAVNITIAASFDWREV